MHSNADTDINYDGEEQAQKLTDLDLNSSSASQKLCELGWTMQPVGASVFSSANLEQYYVYPEFVMKI